MATEWFAVRCLFEVPRRDPFDDGGRDYEERLTLWQADSPEQAIAMAEADAGEYAAQLDGGARYLDFAQSYQLFEEPGHGAEVFSLMRSSRLDRDDYLARFFDTGAEHQGTIGT